MQCYLKQDIKARNFHRNYSEKILKESIKHPAGDLQQIVKFKFKKTVKIVGLNPY